MKLYPEKLSASFSKGLLLSYVITGDEPLIRQELCDQIRQQARLEGFIERELFHVETGFDWQEIHYSLNSLSLFAEKRSWRCDSVKGSSLKRRELHWQR